MVIEFGSFLTFPPCHFCDSQPKMYCVLISVLQGGGRSCTTKNIFLVIFLFRMFFFLVGKQETLHLISGIHEKCLCTNRLHCCYQYQGISDSRTNVKKRVHCVTISIKDCENILKKNVVLLGCFIRMFHLNNSIYSCHDVVLELTYPYTCPIECYI